MKNLLLILLGFVVLISCQSEQENDEKTENSKSANPDLIQFVNPFVGTKNMGHTYPGATTPFGMVQLSPETNQLPMYVDGEYNKDAYKYCSGYQYSDSTIFGFTHTHFSGTGHSDLGDFLVMPTNGKEAASLNLFQSLFELTPT